MKTTYSNAVIGRRTKRETVRMLLRRTSTKSNSSFTEGGLPRERKPITLPKVTIQTTRA